MPSTTVYNYVNPQTGEHIVSLLPPDHPQMECLQRGGHSPSTRFGILGMFALNVSDGFSLLMLCFRRPRSHRMVPIRYRVLLT